MDNSIKATFRPATLRLLEIRYNCDLTRAGADIIPFGVLADISAEGTYGLCLIARKALSPAELERIGTLVRADFAVPFTYLLGISDAVFQSEEPMKAFANLVDQHTHSLQFETLPDETISLPLPLVTASGEARQLWAKDQLTSYGNAAYWRMFPDYVPDLVDKGISEEARELDKVAA